MPTDQIKIHSGSPTSFVVSVKPANQRNANGVKPWKLTELRGCRDSCGNAITFNKKRKLNTLKDQSSVKYSRPLFYSGIIKTGLC